MNPFLWQDQSPRLGFWAACFSELSLQRTASETASSKSRCHMICEVWLLLCKLTKGAEVLGDSLELFPFPPRAAKRTAPLVEGKQTDRKAARGKKLWDKNTCSATSRAEEDPEGHSTPSVAPRAALTLH